MPSIRINPDGYVVVQHKAAGLLYVDTVDNFALDYGQAAPAIPSGEVTSYYDADTFRWVCSDGESETVHSFGLPLGVFDNIITGLQPLIDAKAAREAAQA